MTNSVSQKVVVITGAGKGIGKATAKYFWERGFRVFDLGRSGESTEFCEHVYCDVAIPETIDLARDEVFKRCGKVDVLVCNAGFGVSGSVEFTELEDAKRQFDVNFFGGFSTAKAFLPIMRRQKSGNIIFISSVAAEFPIPFQAFYSASKAAINALVYALRQEVKGFGIKVSAVMPGDTRTSFTDNRKKSGEGKDVYRAQGESIKKMEKDERKGMSPDAVAKVVYKQAVKKRPKVLVTVGGSYKFFVFLKRILPNTMANDIVGGMYCKK